MVLKSSLVLLSQFPLLRVHSAHAVLVGVTVRSWKGRGASKSVPKAAPIYKKACVLELMAEERTYTKVGKVFWLK